MPMPLSADLKRIDDALKAALEVFNRLSSRQLNVDRKQGGDPVTEADRCIDETLRQILSSAGEGWLSEETIDDSRRLSQDRVWIVDPLDGTKEYIAGIPEYCVSIGLVESGNPIAGGIANPRTGECFLGARGQGVLVNKGRTQASRRTSLEGATVLASRSEVSRGEWERFRGARFNVRPVGSVAYKLALVAAGLADATWTLVPKHEWDVAAGTALVLASGGAVFMPDGRSPSFNARQPRLGGLIACAPGLQAPLRLLLTGSE